MKTNNHIENLHNLMEKVFGGVLLTPNDYETLSQSIMQKTGNRISVSTLKRCFGYVEGGKTRKSTLDILCQYVGYKDWDSFVNTETIKTIESNPLMAKSIRASDIKKDECITVMWEPNRKCVFRCLGNEHFVVEESLNSKLSVGDTFECGFFINEEPLYLENLTMNGKSGLTYVCGRINGILFIFL